METIKRHKYSILVALVIIFLSFSGPSAFRKISIPAIPHLDKLVHAGMYFFFMFVLLAENRKYLTGARRYLILGILPFFFGLSIEFLQSFLTSSRKGDPVDAVFNLGGIIFAVVAWELFLKITDRKNQI
jgi:VanZ family protein